MTLRELRARLIYKLGLATHIFIHIPKNAGVAVRKAPALQNRLVSADPYFHKSKAYTQELAAYMKERGEHHGYQHARWRDLDPVKLAQLKPVAIIRNPWARTVSRFRFAQTALMNGKIDSAYAAPTFEEFLEERHIYADLPFYWHSAVRDWYPQSDYVTNTDGVIKADLISQETMQSDLIQYFDLKHSLAKRNVSGGQKGDYQSYYTPKTVQIVADWYAKDIELFDFDFDTPARKNTLISKIQSETCISQCLILKESNIEPFLGCLAV